jgi:hypothetical protein
MWSTADVPGVAASQGWVELERQGTRVPAPLSGRRASDRSQAMPVAIEPPDAAELEEPVARIPEGRTRGGAS